MGIVFTNWYISLSLEIKKTDKSVCKVYIIKFLVSKTSLSKRTKEFRVHTLNTYAKSLVTPVNISFENVHPSL